MHDNHCYSIPFSFYTFSTNPVVVAMDEDQLYEQLPDGIRYRAMYKNVSFSNFFQRLTFLFYSNMSGCVAYGSHSFNGVDEKNKQKWVVLSAIMPLCACTQVDHYTVLYADN